jgi:importin-7
LTSVLKLLEHYRNGAYISPRVLQQAIIYVEYAVVPQFTWKFLRQHMLVIIQEILYPLMCHTDEDEDLFENDPVEYIKAKYDVFEDFVSPVNAARQLVYQVANKRKQILEQTMVFCIQVLQNQQLPPRQKDGILHIVGAVAPVLLRKNLYKDQVEMMMVNFVFPEFQSQHGFLRARACWVVKSFAQVEYKSKDNLMTACNNIKQCILNDPCLPVNVEACCALQELINEDDEEVDEVIKQNIGQHIKEIMLKMLDLIRDTENDDISSVIQRLIFIYEDEIALFAVEIMQHLTETFLNVIKEFEEQDEDSDARDDKTITAVGILSTVDSILAAMEGKLEILVELEKIVLPCIYAIIQNGLLDFYEELFSLICTLTSRQISDTMWQILVLLYDIFQNDAADYFTELMPVLHNYVIVDTQAFLANPQRLEIVFNMIKQVLNANVDDDEAESHAAKLLEIIILQCHTKIDHVLPSFLQLIFERVSRSEINSTELRTMCIQVLIAALWCNTDIVLQTLDNASAIQNTGRSVLLDFLQKWFNDMDCFFGLHDRKVCVLGLCTLLQLATKRPHDVAQISDKIIPSICLNLENLEKVYAARAQEDNEDENEDDEDFDVDVESEDEDDDDNNNKKSSKNMEAGEVDDLEEDEEDSDDEYDYSDDEYDEGDKTVLETFTSCIDENDDVDEFVIFKDTLQSKFSFFFFLFFNIIDY